jgi:hypothetical protein
MDSFYIRRIDRWGVMVGTPTFILYLLLGNLKEHSIVRLKVHFYTHI